MQSCYMGETLLLERSQHRFTWLNWLAENSVNQPLDFSTWSWLWPGLEPYVYSHTDQVWNTGLPNVQHALKILLNATVCNWCCGFAELQGCKNKSFSLCAFLEGRQRTFLFEGTDWMPDGSIPAALNTLNLPSGKALKGKTSHCHR